MSTLLQSSFQSQLPRGQRIASWLARSAWLWQPFGLLVLAAGMLWVCYLVFFNTPDGSFTHELVSAAIGAVVTLATAGFIALFALRRQLAAHREKRIVGRFADSSWRNRTIRVGKLYIPNMSIVVSCTQNVPWTSRAVCTFRSSKETRKRHPVVERFRNQWLSEDKAYAAEHGLVFTDNLRAELLSATLDIEKLNRKKIPHFTLTVGTTTYFEFATTALRLDRKVLEENGKEHTLREILGAQPASILDVGNLPIPASIGSGTVVVTSDNRVLLGIRGRTFVAGIADSDQTRVPVHVVAEGLLPIDVGDDGNFSPLEGSKRGLREELQVGNRSEHIARVTELIQTGFAFDQQRWQPYFTFLARLDRTWDEVQTGIASATDAWEAQWISLPFDIEYADLRLLLQGHHPDLKLASNHATVALWFALLYQHGYEQMRNELSGS